MTDLMEIKGVSAKINYDADLELFRGEFIGLNGGADFYANNIDNLRKEGIKSLEMFLDMCKEKGIEPYKHFSGKFNLRITPELHEKVAARARAENKSLNNWIAGVIESTI